jgi:hypothetical protein
MADRAGFVITSIEADQKIPLPHGRGSANPASFALESTHLFYRNLGLRTEARMCALAAV